MRSRNPIVVERQNPRKDLTIALKEGTARLQAGISLIVFPQSTRASSFDPQAFNSIGEKMARHSGVPIVPVALKTDAWGQGRLIKEIGVFNPAKTIHYRFAKPVRVDGNAKNIHVEICSFIASALQEWNSG